MDTDKGLISSSSSSSTRPTPRPHRVRPKPLPKELLSKLSYLHGFGEHRFSLYSNLIIPVNCIDPDDPSSWEHINDDVDEDKDEDDGLFFLRVDTRLFSLNNVPLVIGRKIYGFPIFELYSIKIIKLDSLRDFSSIFMKGSNTSCRPMIIYKRPEGEKIPLNQPLPLINIFRLPSVEKTVLIGLSNPSNGGWSFSYYPPYFDSENIEFGLCIEKVTDELTESEALISYELIESAATAELEFTFVDDKLRPLTIFFGSITATTDGDPSTERIIGQFSSSEPSVLLQSNEPVPVHRSVFGVPLGSCLNLVANLKYFVEKDGPYNMEGGFILPVPKKTESVEECITSPDGITKMRVKVSWWDYME